MSSSSLQVKHEGACASMAEAIVRVASRQRVKFNVLALHSIFASDFVNGAQPSEFVPLMLTSPTSADGQPSGLGIFEKLPLELVLAICTKLDIESVLRFRQACRGTRAVVFNMVEYAAVVKEAAHLIPATLRSEVAGDLTFADLHRALRAPSCEACGKRGKFIYLPLAARACYVCLLNGNRFKTVTLASYMRMTRITEDRVREAGVRILQSLPDQNGIKGKKTINFEEVTKAFGTNPQLDLGRGYRGGNLYNAAFMSTTFLPYKMRLGNRRLSLLCDGCHIQSRANTAAGERPKAKIFDDLVEFMTHFYNCIPAQKIWKASKNGTVDMSYQEKFRVLSVL